MRADYDYLHLDADHLAPYIAQLSPAARNLFLEDKDGVRGTPCCSDIRPGWWKHIKQALEKIADVGAGCLMIAQIKQKYGGLRIYVDSIEGQWPEGFVASVVDEIVLDAEELCSTTCEECGAGGATANPRGYIQTLCLDCRKVMEHKNR